MKQTILIFLLSILILIQVAVSTWIQMTYSDALRRVQEDLACARLNKDYVSVGNDLCFDTKLVK